MRSGKKKKKKKQKGKKGKEKKKRPIFLSLPFLPFLLPSSLTQFVSARHTASPQFEKRADSCDWRGDGEIAGRCANGTLLRPWWTVQAF
jgi:hypothetical protein